MCCRSSLSSSCSKVRHFRGTFQTLMRHFSSDFMPQVSEQSLFLFSKLRVRGRGGEGCEHLRKSCCYLQCCCSATPPSFYRTSALVRRGCIMVEIARIARSVPTISTFFFNFFCLIPGSQYAAANFLDLVSSPLLLRRPDGGGGASSLCCCACCRLPPCPRPPPCLGSPSSGSSCNPSEASLTHCMY